MFLLLRLATVSLPWQETSTMRTEAAPVAGCHQHGAKPPAPTPSNYRCCQIGHNSALLQSATSTQLPLVAMASAHTQSPKIVISPRTNLVSATILSPDPPHTIPLRV
jgi:hypothetical protein